MKLVRHHTDEGQYMALVVKTGRKYLHLLYIGKPRLTRVLLSEERNFKNVTEATLKQVRQFNRVSRKFGATKRLA